MTKVTYKPDPAHDMPAETDQYGHHFKANVPVDVVDEAHLAKFRGNPFFDVDGHVKPTAPEPAAKASAKK